MAKKKKRKSFIPLVLVFVIVLLAGKVVYKEVCEYLYPKKYSEYVEYYAQQYKISETLLYAVIHTESGFDPVSVSSADARGFTQITEDTFDWLVMKTGEDYTFDDLFTPEVSIKYGAYFLSVLQNEYAITETVIAAYHAGMGNVSSWLENPEYSKDGKTLCKIPYLETRRYTEKIKKYTKIYRFLYPKLRKGEHFR